MNPPRATQVQFPQGLLRRHEVHRLIGLRSKSTLYELMKDGRFPLPVKLTGRAVAWRSEDVSAWIESRTAIPAEQDISPLAKRTGTTTSRTANTWTITLTFATEAEAMAAYQALPQPVQREQQEAAAC